jgi:hypothetical protein
MKKPLIGSVTARPASVWKIRVAVALSQARRSVLVLDARADREIGLARLQRLQHRRQDALVVLQIAVDDRNVVGAGRKPALDDRAGEAVAVDAAKAAHPRIGFRDVLRDLPGEVGRIVVDDDEFPVEPHERGLELFEQGRDVLRLPVGWRDHGQRRRRASGGLGGHHGLRKRAQRRPAARKRITAAS